MNSSSCDVDSAMVTVVGGNGNDIFLGAPDLFSDERKLYIRAVFDGRLEPSHITEDEMAALHHALTDQAMGNIMDELADRTDITVFNHDWEFDKPN
jgi:hypothetical protein